MSQDIENLLPTTNITKENSFVRVVNKRRQNEFTETNIELIKLYKSIADQPINYQNSNIHHAICLTIEDVKRSRNEQNCWKFHTISYRNVLLYGHVNILNERSIDGRQFYTLSIDDETECIEGYLNKFNSKEQPEKKMNDFDRGKKTLERREETGINLQGIYYPSDSVECQNGIKNLKLLQIMIEKNLKSTEKKFPLGPLQQKAIIYGCPIVRNNNIRLNIFDLSLNDDLELAWKRNINKLYSDSYFK